VNRWPNGDPNAVVKQVLAQPAYRKTPTHADSPTLRFWYELGQWLDRLFSPFRKWLDHTLSSGHGTAQILVVAIVVVTILVLVLLIYRIVLAFAKPVVAARRLAAVGAPDERLDADAWRALAAERAAAGDYARAIAALFRAALALLDESALVPFDSSRTPGEYRRLVRRESERIAAPFDVLCERFVWAAFAEAIAQRGDFEAASAAFGAFGPLVARG
jgi:hypothetical protein